MAKKKNKTTDSEETVDQKKGGRDSSVEEELPVSDDATLDPAIIEDTFTEEFSEYNDVDNF